MTGKEIAVLLGRACDDAGLDAEAKRRVMLHFTVRWGQSLGADLDLAMYEDEMREQS